MDQRTLDAYDQPMFDAGDRVVDTESADPDAMVVLDPDVGTSADVAVGEQTVAELNPSYPVDERVVETAYVDYLDSYVAPWREWPSGELDGRFEAFCRQWGVREATYSYPEGRLRRAPEA